MRTMFRHAQSDLRPPNSNGTMFSVALKSTDKSLLIGSLTRFGFGLMVINVLQSWGNIGCSFIGIWTVYRKGNGIMM